MFFPNVILTKKQTNRIIDCEELIDQLLVPHMLLVTETAGSAHKMHPIMVIAGQSLNNPAEYSLAELQYKRGWLHQGGLNSV